MKKSALALFLAALSTNAVADDFTIGYANTNIEIYNEDESANGISLTYAHFEKNNNIGLMITGTYTEFNKSYNIYSLDYKQLSFGAGPLIQLNDYVSLYGVLGLSRVTAEASIIPDNHNGSATVSDTSANYGAGIRIYPTDRFVINAGIEVTEPEHEDESTHAKTFTIGAGYRF